MAHSVGFDGSAPLRASVDGWTDGVILLYLRVKIHQKEDQIFSFRLCVFDG